MRPRRILLLSLPWAPFHRPSIQLGALKSYLAEQRTYLEIRNRHPYLEVALAIGFERYHLISARSWAGEALYGGLLFPPQRPRASRLFAAELPRLGSRCYDELLPILSDSLDTLLEQELSEDWDLVGLSVCFSQLTASLLTAKRIKERRPTLPIVLGGSAVTPSMARELPGLFPEISCCITGEGEGPLLEIVDTLIKGRPLGSGNVPTPSPTPCTPSPHQGRNTQIAALDSLPIPDFTDYFQEVSRLGLAFIPELPVEFSRGCWWNRCRFCNLNLQWQGYRHKTHQRMAAEIRNLATRHRCLDFSFTDNALPPAEARAFFQGQLDSPIDYRFFAEIRALPDPDQYGRFRRGGLTEVQIGIEALSDSLLERMGKGSRAIDNIAALKHAQEHGLRLAGNLILEFPGATALEVEETLKALDAVLPYPPLAPATFFLGAESPIYLDPAGFGITTIEPHPKYRCIFPPALLRKLQLITLGYRGDRGWQRRLWAPVRHKMRGWRKFHDGRKNRFPALSYRDGGNFLIIRQERPGQPVLHHRLQGLSREIYLHCRVPIKRKRLPQVFSQVKEKQISHFLTDLEAKHLLFQDHDSCLALAIRQT